MNQCWGITGSFKTGNIQRCKNTPDGKLFCRQHKRQPLYWIFCLIFSVVIPLLHFFPDLPSRTINNIFYSKTNDSELNKFDKDVFGILVSEFKDANEKDKINGKSIQISIVSTLNARFYELNVLNAKAKPIPHHLLKIRNHEQARNIGNKYNAQIVIWGDITIAGVIPKLTIVEQNSLISAISKPEIILFKKELTHEALNKINNIRLPAFTDEPINLVLFTTGIKYLDDGKYDIAIEFLYRSLPDNPSNAIDNASILPFIGIAYVHQKEYDKAISICKKALDIDPKSVSTKIVLAVSYYKKGDIEKTISFVSEILSELLPISKEISKVFIYLARSEFDKAIELCTKMINNNLEVEFGYYFRARAFQRKGEYENAISDYNKGIEINPSHGLVELVILDERGQCYIKLKRYDEAISDFSKVLSKRKNNAASYYYRGIAHQRKRDHKRAVQDFSKVTKSSLHYHNALLLKGISNIHEGFLKKAISNFDSAIKSKPKDTEAYYRKALCYEKMGNSKAAIKTYKILISNSSSKDVFYISAAYRRISVLKSNLE